MMCQFFDRFRVLDKKSVMFEISPLQIMSHRDGFCGSLSVGEIELDDRNTTDGG